MNAKALIERYMDFPTEQRLMYTLEFSLIAVSGGGFLAKLQVDAYFAEGDTVTQIKNKIRDAVIARSAEAGFNVNAINVGSIFQI